MTQLLFMIQSWLASRDEQGATMIEYGIMVALIAVAAYTAVDLLGGRVITLFDTVTF